MNIQNVTQKNSAQGWRNIFKKGGGRTSHENSWWPYMRNYSCSNLRITYLVQRMNIKTQKDGKCLTKGKNDKLIRWKTWLREIFLLVHFVNNRQICVSIQRKEKQLEKTQILNELYKKWGNNAALPQRTSRFDRRGTETQTSAVQNFKY
jgi:hypothetical protein